MKVSNSEIQSFKRCRRKWWFQYYRSLSPLREEVVGPRSVGTRVHACLEAYYAGDRQAGPALELHEQLVGEDVLRAPDQLRDIQKEADLSRAMLTGYFEWLEETGADEGLTVIAAEKAIETSIEVAGVPVTIRAKLDLVVRRESDEAVMFLDHKTVQEFTTPTRTLHLDEQMLLYHWLLAAEHDWQHTAGGAIYNMIRKSKRTATAKPPFYERFEVRHSDEEVRSFIARTKTTIGEMLVLRQRLDEADLVGQSVIAYPTPTRNCSWDCDFFAVCPLVDRQDIGGGEGLIETLYVTSDPYARYQEPQS